MIHGGKLKIWVLIPEGIENFLKDCGVTESQITFAEMPLKKIQKQLLTWTEELTALQMPCSSTGCHLLWESEE